LMSRRSAEPTKPRPALRRAVAYALCHASRMAKVEIRS
jgi:hypothetical protein